MCWKRKKTRVYERDHHHGKTHFFLDKFVYFIHGGKPTTFSNNEDRLLDLRAKYSLTYCMFSITFGCFFGIVGFFADDWVVMAGFNDGEKYHTPYQPEEPDVRLKKGLILAVDYLMIKDTMIGRLVEELGLLEKTIRCIEM